MPHSFFVAILLSCWLLGGCAAKSSRTYHAYEAFFSGELQLADELLVAEGQRAGRLEVAQLDRAMVQLAAGRPQVAEQFLRQVRDHFDHVEQFSISERGVSLLTDDTHDAYAGTSYEKVLVRALLAISNLMQDGDDALAYCTQVEMKQRDLLDHADLPPEARAQFPLVAFGPYLYGILREESHADFNDSIRSYERVASWEPDFVAVATDLARVRAGRHSAPGNGVLYVLTFVGRGPRKYEVSELPSTAALAYAEHLLRIAGHHELPPTLATIKVPAIALSENEVQSVRLWVDGQPVGATETVTDVGQLAVRQHQLVFDQIVGRAVARRTLKKALVYTGAKAADVEHGSLASVAVALGGAAWEAAERADTRCWGLLPAQIQTLRVELPAGRHQLQLAAACGPSGLGPSAQVAAEIYDGRNTYLVANFPDRQLSGQVLVR